MPLINDAGDVALGPASATHRILPVVVAGKYNTSWMFHLHIRNLQTVDDTMSQVHQFLRSAQYRGSSAVRRGFLFNLFFKTSIHKAEILMVDVLNEDPEAVAWPRKVTVTAHEYSHELTEFFRCPALSKYCGRFANRYPDVLCDAAQTKFILIHYETSKTAMGIAATLAVAFWLLLSALVGIIQKDMEAGFTVAGVGIGVMALCVAVIKGIQK